ncbi:MAG: YifB family Mg chelatase-like AAA ATPase [Planctomycetota bacterium]
MRTARVHGISLAGTEADLVTVEARFERADRQRTEVVLSGLPDPVIRESRGRLLSALEANRLRLPPGRLTLNLTPAGRRKTGESLDLPLALGAAAAAGHLTPDAGAGALFLGELGIDGRLYAVPGGLAAAELARRTGLAAIVAAPATASEAACLPGVNALAARDLAQVVRWAATGEGLAAAPPTSGAEGDGAAAREEGLRRAAAALAGIRGQEAGKRAAVVAAAGGHGLLLVGPPGAGKSLLARALVHLLPPPSLEERLEITRVLSAAGRWPRGLAAERPFRAPHHTTSYAGLVGGGNPPAPGEITLAHRGVLFLDELPELKREALEALRQPLESGSVLLSRSRHWIELPAAFLLVAAMNPCPCGYHGHPAVPCRCSPAEIRRYHQRISGPLLDRIELRVELPAPPVAALAPAAPGALPGLLPAAAALPAAVARASAHRAARQGRVPNAMLEAADLDRWAPLGPSARRLLERAAAQRGLSGRALQSLRRVARTLADLEAEERPDDRHFAEALALRASI